MSHINNQHSRAMALRERIRASVTILTGSTTLEISKAAGVVRPTAAGHLNALRDSGAVRVISIHHISGGSMSIWYPLEGEIAPYEQPAKKVTPKSAPAAEDFIGVKTVKAVQIGMVRDPLTAALFGARRVAA